MRAIRSSSLVASISAALVVVTAAHAELGWRWEHPQPMPDHFWPVWGTGPDDVYVGGTSGTLLHFDGRAWSVAVESWGCFYAIGGSSATDVWAVGEGQAWHYDGTRWSVDPSLPPGYSWQGIWASGPGDVYLAGFGSSFSAVIAHRQAGNWTLSPIAIGGTLNGIWGSGPEDIWAIGSDAILHFDGEDWTTSLSSPSSGFFRIWGSAPDRIFVGTQAGSVLRWDGVDWEVIGSGFGYVTGISGSGPSDVEISTYGGTVHRWNGTGWTPTGASQGQRLMGLWTVGPDEAFAVGDLGTILHRQGSSWFGMQRGPVEALNDVWADPSGIAFAVGDEGVILRFDGEKWSTSPRFDGRDRLFAVWGSSPTDVWAVGDEAIVHFDGSEWVKVLTTESFHTDVWGSGPEDVYVVGYYASYHFDGESWSEIAMGGGGESARAIWGSASDDIFVVGDTGLILHFDGVDWEPMSSGTLADLRSVWGSSASDVWAVGHDWSSSDDVVLHFDGVGWSEVLPALIDLSYWKVTGVGPGEVYISTSLGTLRYDGSAWRYLDAPGFLGSLVTAAGTGQPGELLLVGYAGSIARRFPHFASDFERGDLCQWSAAAPSGECWPFPSGLNGGEPGPLP